MTELYVVRHGETEWSASGRHTSVTDLELTDRGVRQAESLHGHLDPAAFGLILSSPRRRALRTAELAGFVGPYEPEVSEDLVEWFYGDYEGLTSDQIHETDPGWTIFTHPTPGGETHDQVTERLDRVVERIRSPAWSGPSASRTATRCGRSRCAGWAWTWSGVAASRWRRPASRSSVRRRASRRWSAGTRRSRRALPGPVRTGKRSLTSGSRTGNQE